MIKIDVVIPILNEESSLDAQVRKAVDYLESTFQGVYRTRLKIADNGSSDRSFEIGASLQSEIEMVDYVRVGERGVGRALKFAWTQSEADIIGYMDLDLATDLRHLPDALGPLAANDADIVTGSRLKSGSKVRGRSPTREMTSRALNLMVRAYFGTSFTDGMCGFKFLRRQYLSRLMEMGAMSDGWFFATELLICAEHAGLRMIDLPVEWSDDRSSKAKIGKLALEYTAAMRTLKRHLNAADATIG